MSTSAIGSLHDFLQDFVHTHAPHTSEEFYLLSLIGALLFAGTGRLLPLIRHKRHPLRRPFSGKSQAYNNGPGNSGQIPAGVSIANLSSGSSFVIYLIMPLVPFDGDLLAPLAQSWFTVALAGIIGASITLRSLWHGPHGAQHHKPMQAKAQTCEHIPLFRAGDQLAAERPL